MKHVHYLLIAITLFSCDQQPSIKSDAESDLLKKSRHASLLAFFDNVVIDTLAVYSPSDSSSAFNGKPIDSANVRLFPAEISQGYHRQEPMLFAIYKFAIDKNRLGLIVRTPSDYISSSIKLFFFDMKKDSLTGYIELGELVGDAGDFMTKYSWLIRDGNKNLLALVNTTNGHYNSVDNPKDTTVSRNEFYDLLDLTKPSIDTLVHDKKQAPEAYTELIKTKRAAKNF